MIFFVCMPYLSLFQQNPMLSHHFEDNCVSVKIKHNSIKIRKKNLFAYNIV